VAELFIGESTNKVDGKGRVSIPAHFRRVLDEGDPLRDQGTRPRIVMSYGDPKKPYVECYTYAAFADLTQSIMDLPRGSTERSILTAMVLGKSHTTDIDGDGRLVLAQLDLNGDTFFSGAGDTFQIWNVELQSKVEKSRVDAWFHDKPDDFDMLILIDQFKQERSKGTGGQGA
jgi:MraZ protein